jgi:glycosyltransferase involved in cell wall biosynthesis
VRYPLAVRGLDADLYHVADQGYGQLAALLPRDRVVITCHDLMLRRAERADIGFRGRRTTVAAFRWATSYLRKVAHVVCPSEASRRDAVVLAGVDVMRTSVIPQGVDDVFRPLPTAERLAPTRHAVLHVATRNPYKNSAGAVRVVTMLRDRGLDVSLVRVGPGLPRPFDGVVELGQLPEARLVQVYNACDALLFPSFWEGFGWPPLEAMACGLPVVVSDAPALVELVGDAALSAPARDLQGLARAVYAVLNSPQLAEELRGRGLERAANYTWSRTADAYSEVYERVATEHGALASTLRLMGDPGW